MFISLPLPAGLGVGAAVDVSALATPKTLVVEGAEGANILILEGSHNGVNFAPILQVTQYSDPGTIVFPGTWRFLRLRLFSGFLPTAASVGGESAANNFTTLTAAGVDTSGFGGDQTVQLVGTFSGLVVIEGSDDLGVTFNPSPIAFFNAGNSDIRYITGVYSRMRARQVSGAGTFVVTMGATALGGEGAEGEGFALNGAETNEVGTNNSVEQVLLEWYPTFGVLGTPCMLAQLGFFGRREAGTLVTAPTVRLRVGSSAPGVADGTVVSGPVSLFSTSEIPLELSAVIPRPAARSIVQVTVTGGTTTVPADIFGFIRAVVAQFSEAGCP